MKFDNLLQFVIKSGFLYTMTTVYNWPLWRGNFACWDAVAVAIAVVESLK